MRLPRSAMLRSATILDLMSPEGSKSKITTLSDMATRASTSGSCTTATGAVGITKTGTSRSPLRCCSDRVGEHSNSALRTL
jgi:hypothetical protein